MINKVSQITFSAVKKENPSDKKVQNISRVKQTSYIDSFVSNACESAPTLLALTGLWSLLDFGTGKVSMAKSLKNNLAFFFAPVLIVSSSIMAGIENKKTSKSSKP